MGRRSSQILINMVGSANNEVLGTNPTRRYVRFPAPAQGGYNLFLNSPTANNAGGEKITPGMPAIEWRYEDIGDAIYGPMSIWNAGNVQPIVCIEAYD